MKPVWLRKIPLLAVVLCISMAVVVTEAVAAYEFAHHDCTGLEDNCAICNRVKAAADFLDTLRLECIFAIFFIFTMFIPAILKPFRELNLVLLSPITLKVRSDT
jgi:hypothetical protein